MKTTVAFLVLTLVAVLFSQQSQSQGFLPPSEGKAVIYFVMPKTYFDKFKFKIFHNDKFLTEIKSENYFRYECSPGKHLFWSVSENHEYLEAELEAGKTYIIQATVTMGVFKGRGFFTPVSYTDKERFEKTRTVIMTFPPFIPAEASVTKMNEKLAKEIRECLQDYETKKKSDTKFNVLPSDMAVPEDLMK